MSRGPGRRRSHARVITRERSANKTSVHTRRAGGCPPRRIPFNLRRLSSRSRVITRNFVRLNVVRAACIGPFRPGRLSKNTPLPRTASHPLVLPPIASVPTYVLSSVHQEFVSRPSASFSFAFVFYRRCRRPRVFVTLTRRNGTDKRDGGGR